MLSDNFTKLTAVQFPTWWYQLKLCKRCIISFDRECIAKQIKWISGKELHINSLWKHSRIPRAFDLHDFDLARYASVTETKIYPLSAIFSKRKENKKKRNETKITKNDFKLVQSRSAHLPRQKCIIFDQIDSTPMIKYSTFKKATSARR